MGRFIIIILYIFGIQVFAGVATISNYDSEKIKDRKCIDKTFDMTSSIIITDIIIEVNIDHTYRDDLYVSLISPHGTSVDLNSDNGGSADNLYVEFNDSAAMSIVNDTNTHTIMVERRPESPLSLFDSEDAYGLWTLHICDDYRQDEGEYNYAILHIYGSPPPPIESGLQVDFRMDECYWLGGANGVTDDVKDSSGNGLDAQSRNKANNISSIYKICRGGDFINTYNDQSKSDAVYYPNSTATEMDIGEDEPFSVSAWVYRHGDSKWMAAVIKVGDDSWTDGWGLEHRQNSSSNIDFFVGHYNTYARAILSDDTWTHIVGTYDGSTIRIYKNGVLADTETQSSYSPGALAVSIGDDISGSDIDDRWQGNLDEVKIWHRALSTSEISDIYNNENSGLNYDGTTRVCKSCNGSSISANTWDLVGVPADSRTTPLSVDDIFGDDMNGTIGTDWVVYKRTYSSTDNSSGYLSLGLSDSLEFGQGYWLGSKLNSEWYIDGAPTVDYDSTSTACTASACVEIDLRSVTHDFAVDGNDGTGPYRYNMSGFIGVRVPINWADCRFLIDGTAYTPSQADTAGYASKQIWLYNGTGTDRSNSYITCDDTTPGECKLVPFKGFWVELHGPTKNKTVKLLIPQE
ncbi:MAG: hypothetical protein DRG30_04390 [Epsilonproteobacteria bacterium]|nr:MAG: hypothetical protein DRG30_04390 [Campylobacterota bacterium]